MAYVFNGINGLMKPEEQQQRQDIFAPSADGQQSGGMQDGGGSQVKTSTQGEIAGVNSQGAQPTPQPQQAQQQSSDARLMQRNKVSATPGFAKKAQGDLAAQQQKLQDDANAYTQKQSQTQYGVDSGTLDKAIGGGQEEATKVRGLLGGQASRVEDFDTSQGYDVNDIYQMQTDAGVENLLRRESGPEYNSGEAAFDRALLGKSAEFNQLRSLLKGEQEKLNTQADEYRGSKTKEAQQAADARYAQAQKEAQAYLGSKGDEIRAANQAEVDAENAARAELRAKGDQGYMSAQEAKALRELQRQYKGTNPSGTAKYLKPGAVDASKYVNYSGDVGLEDAIDESEASRFNSIMGLLGKGDSLSAGKGFGSRQSFNADKYAGDLERVASSQNEAADRGAQSAIDKALAKIRARNSGAQAYRDAQIKSINDELAKEYGAFDAGDASQFYGELGNDALLTDKDIASLNPYFAELGTKNNLKAGGGMAGAFNSDAYRQAMIQQLDSARAMQAEADAAKEAEKDARTQRVGNVPVGVTRGQVRDINARDKKATGNQALNPWATVRKDKKVESAAFNDKADKVQKRAEKAGSDIKSGYNKARNKLGI